MNESVKSPINLNFKGYYSCNIDVKTAYRSLVCDSTSKCVRASSIGVA